ncbi:hypothetical protein QFC20_004094 [Naganishia adeliensis]|uniref:Uncharacterized protein n=1 Tax=Naganishia adeliensis TaxID=92952 RepID=A0ACC2W4A5_9TREE|nr:hypothetical protein QFC20_004094 [Naganishia adeliensis]
MSKQSGNPMRQPGYNPLAGATMAIGRALDPVLQYNLLRKGYAGQLLHLAGLKRIITLPLVNRVGLNADFFGAGLVDKPGNMLLAMSGITALRHIYWALFINESAFSPGMAAGVSTYNCLLNTINSLVFVYQVSRGKTNPLASNWMQYLGFAFLLTGTVGEIMIEETRKAFKKNSANQGRIHDTGAFGVVRHPNYAFYSLWRVGMAMATGSWVNALVNGLFQVAFFAGYSIPEISTHMSDKYRSLWTDYTRKVPYALIPYIY